MNAKSEFYVGESLYYGCKAGYKLVGPSSRKCSASYGDNGIWSGIYPRCEEIRCPVPKYPLHGTQNGTKFTFGNTVNFKCNPGYTLIGSEKIICSDSGEWIGNIPKCERKFKPKIYI